MKETNEKLQTLSYLKTANERLQNLEPKNRELDREISRLQNLIKQQTEGCKSKIQELQIQLREDKKMTVDKKQALIEKISRQLNFERNQCKNDKEYIEIENTKWKERIRNLGEKFTTMINVKKEELRIALQDKSMSEQQKNKLESELQSARKVSEQLIGKLKTGLNSQMALNAKLELMNSNLLGENESFQNQFRDFEDIMTKNENLN